MAYRVRRGLGVSLGTKYYICADRGYGIYRTADDSFVGKGAAGQAALLAEGGSLTQGAPNGVTLLSTCGAAPAAAVVDTRTPVTQPVTTTTPASTTQHTNTVQPVTTTTVTTTTQQQQQQQAAAPVVSTSFLTDSMIGDIPNWVLLAAVGLLLFGRKLL